MLKRLGSSHHGTVSALALFLLSGLLLLPLLFGTFKQTDAPTVPNRYVFRGSSPAPRMPAALHSIAGELRIRQWHYVPDLEVELAQFETVFWEPDDTTSLRRRIATDSRLQGAVALEIGTGTGLIASALAIAGAQRVVATDVNPRAVANALYNLQNLGLDDRVEVRYVSPSDPGPFSTVADDEQFDFIISNPPWEDAPVESPAAYALYDPQFQLLDGILEQSSRHLRPNGELWLAYGAKTAIRRVLERAHETGWDVEVDDPRHLDELPEVFLPGMLLKLSRRSEAQAEADVIN
ncbi:MAG: class I SAM-dependent methyltransferase [Planctomycetota bacterium]|nr:MAG: class I SAM-dependent methyltransferase [Planctomycetota bacterium]